MWVLVCLGFSRTQKCVTLSTMEAEYVALADITKEVLSFRQVWRFMLPDVGMPCIPVFEGNQGAVQLAQNPIVILQLQAHPRGTGREGRHIDCPRSVPFSACGFPNQSDVTGVFRVSPYPCDEHVVTYS